MDTGERLSAFVAGELDVAERAELEAQLAGDRALREQLERIRRADVVLRSLGDVAPPPGFSARLHERLDQELAVPPRDELAVRRARSAWRPLVTAAAAAAVLVVVGVGGGILLRGGGGVGAGDDPMTLALEDGDGAGVQPVRTDNDYNETELQRLAVGVELGVPADIEPEEADVAAQEAAGVESPPNVVYEVGTATGGGAEDQQGGAGEGGGPAAPGDEPVRANGTDGDDPGASRRDQVEACLPQLLEQTTSPVILVYVELAKFEGEPAIIYVFAARDPETDEYRRAEVWAVAPEDCQVLAFAQYDQPPIPGS